jgi:hypothetical protein
MSNDTAFVNGLVGIFWILSITVVLFLFFRFIVLWYWRVNEAISLLKSIDEKLGRMSSRP